MRKERVPWRMRVEDAQCGLRRMCCISYPITHSQRWSYFLCNRTFPECDMVYLCLRLSCTTSMCTKVAARKPPSSVLAICVTSDCGHPSVSLPCCALTRQYLQDVMYTHTQLAWMGNTGSSCYSSLIISENISVNVWAGTVDDYVIWPYTTQDHLGGANHEDFLEERSQLRLYMCVRPCGFSMAVVLPILHAECSTGFTTFLVVGLGVEVRSPSPQLLGSNPSRYEGKDLC